MLLGDHTAADADDEVFVFGLDMLVLSNDGQSLFFGVLTNGASIDNDQVGGIGTVGGLIAHVNSHAQVFFAVRFILLTTKGLDENLALFGCALVPRPHFFHIFKPRQKIVGRHDELLCHICYLPLGYIISHFTLYLIFRFLSRKNP